MRAYARTDNHQTYQASGKPIVLRLYAFGAQGLRYIRLVPRTRSFSISVADCILLQALGQAKRKRWYTSEVRGTNPVTWSAPPA